MRALAFSGGKDSMACLHLMRDSLDCAIYVNTGFAYPETLALVEYARGILPVHEVRTDRKGQNDAYGIPADVVPVDWTVEGQIFGGKKPFSIQSSLRCCAANIMVPLWSKAIELGVTELVIGQRDDELKTSPARDGDTVLGIKRVQPLEKWTTTQVLQFLDTKMDVPRHYSLSRSSLDCYDCPGFRKHSEDLIEWTLEHHPDLYSAYSARCAAVDSAIQEALH